LAGGCPQPAATSASASKSYSRSPQERGLQSGAKNFAHLKLKKLSTYKTFATKLIGTTRLARRASEHVTARS
jgi:hypothetical protein